MKAHWRLFTDCNSAKAAGLVAARHFAIAGVDGAIDGAAPHAQGGFVVDATASPAPAPWPTAVLDALSVAQRTGRGWVLSGNIGEELDLWCNDSKVSGIVAIHFRMVKDHGPEP